MYVSERKLQMNKVFKILGKHGRVTIPYEIRTKLGFSYNDVLSFEERDNNTVVVKREKICDCCGKKPETKNQNNDLDSLFDFIDELSDEEKKVAFFHLLNEWEKIKGENINA